MSLLDSRLYRALQGVIDFVFLSLLWLLTCVPILTVPAATAAMFGVVREWVNNREPPIAGTFLSLFKENFRQSLWIGTLWALVGMALGVDLVFISAVDFALKGFLYVLLFLMLLLYLFTSVYLFPVMVTYSTSWPKILRNALLFSLSDPLNVLLCLMVIVLAAAITVFLPPLLLITASTVTYFVYRTCNKTFQRAEQLMESRSTDEEDRQK